MGFKRLDNNMITGVNGTKIIGVICVMEYFFLLKNTCDERNPSNIEMKNSTGIKYNKMPMDVAIPPPPLKSCHMGLQ